MKTLKLTLLYLLIFINSEAQTIQFKGSVSQNDNALDSKGNIFNVGAISGNVDFSPSENNFILSTPETDDIHAYITKISNSGDVLWAKVFNTQTINNELGEFSRILKVITDENDNIYVAGAYKGILHLNESIILNSGSVNNQNSFILKLDTSGNILWYKEFLDVDIQNNGLDEITIGDINFQNSKLYVGIQFKGNTDFGFTNLLTSSGNGQKSDLVFLTYDTNGNEQLIKQITAEQIGFNALDNVHLIFRAFIVNDNCINAIATTGTSRTLISIKLLLNNTIEKFVTMSAQNSFSYFIINDVAEDNNKNIFIAGRFKGSVDINSNSSELNTISSGNLTDIFILKMNSNYEYVWHKQIPNFNPSYAQLLNDLEIIDDNVFIFGNVTTGGSQTYDLSGQNNLMTTITGQSGFYVTQFSGVDGSFLNTLFLKYYKNNTTSPPVVIGNTLNFYNDNIYISGPLVSNGTVEFLDKSIVLEANKLGSFISKFSKNNLISTLSTEDIILNEDDVKVYQNDNHFIVDKSNYTLKIYNILGKEIENTQLSKGLYLLKVLNNSSKEIKVLKRIIH